MRTREHLESYVYSTAGELRELGAINWPQNRNKLEARINSLESFIHEAVLELKSSYR